jgi:hypothetical protein
MHGASGCYKYLAPDGTKAESSDCAASAKGAKCNSPGQRLGKRVDLSRERCCWARVAKQPAFQLKFLHSNFGLELADLRNAICFHSRRRR